MTLPQYVRDRSRMSDLEVTSVSATQSFPNSHQSSNLPIWMNSREAAKYLGFQKPNAFKTAERYARECKLPAYFRFNRWYFSKEELDCWIKAGVSSRSQSVRSVN
jgi:hypothetical protein